MSLGNSWNGNSRYDNGYNQGYDYQGYGNGYSNGSGNGYGKISFNPSKFIGYSQGYGYNEPPPSNWGPSSASNDNGFPPYQQSYGGGPMRNAPPAYPPRAAPYGGQNNWQPRP